MHIFSLCLYVGIFAGTVTSAALGLQRFRNLTSPQLPFPFYHGGRITLNDLCGLGPVMFAKKLHQHQPQILKKHFHPDGWKFPGCPHLSPAFPSEPGIAGTSNFRNVRNLSHHRPEARDAWRWLDVRHPEKVTDDGGGVRTVVRNHYDLHHKVMMNSWGRGPKTLTNGVFFGGLLNTPLESRLWFVSWHRIMITTVRSLWRPTSALEWPRFLRMSSYCWWKKSCTKPCI